MTFAATIYVDASGSIYGASETDQRYTRHASGRTVNGRPVVCAGRWYGSQMSYRPYRDCVAAAAREAASLVEAK